MNWQRSMHWPTSLSSAEAWCPRGGHNIIEPAQHGVAIVIGNHTENFRDISRLVSKPRCGANRQISRSLPLTLMQLLADDAERGALGRRATDTMRSQTGATARTLEGLETLLTAAPDQPVTAQAAHTD